MDGKSSERRERPGVTPRLWPELPAIVLVLLLALVAAAVAYVGLTLLLDLPVTPSNARQRDFLIESFKVAVGVAAGLGAVVALTINYRRHRLERSQSERDDQRLFTDRFQAAAEQLGREQPAVRLAGVHAMARLADDWDEQRQTCIDVLCAYLRLPASGEPQSAASIDEAFGAGLLSLLRARRSRALRNNIKHQPTAPAAEREVRQTVVRLITDHLRIDRTETTEVSWQGHNFDFTGVVFDGGMFNFSAAQFSGGQVSFEGAQFSSGKVSFATAKFSGAEVSFLGAVFSGGEVSFLGTEFSSGKVSFATAKFSGAEASFLGAVFSGGEVRFLGTVFSGGRVGFDAVEFSDSKIGFRGAEFHGGEVRFFGAVFSGGEVSFFRAEFSGGYVAFKSAEFAGGEVSFLGAVFSGGQVSFEAPGKWERPPRFDPLETLPTGLLLPS